jgi:molybdopterin synthase catalytic subunit
MSNVNMKKKSPSMDEWLKEAKADPAVLQEGMFLVHNGVVRQTPKAKVRQGFDDGSSVKGMEFDYDAAKVDAAIAEAYKMDGIFNVRVWLNRGKLELGDDIMYVLIGGDIRPHVIDALQFLVGKIKSECVTEIEQKYND